MNTETLAMDEPKDATPKSDKTYGGKASLERLYAVADVEGWTVMERLMNKAQCRGYLDAHKDCGFKSKLILVPEQLSVLDDTAVLNEAERHFIKRHGSRKQDGTLRIRRRDKFIVVLRDTEDASDVEQVYACENYYEAGNFCKEWEAKKGELNYAAEIVDREGNPAVDTDPERANKYAPKYPRNMPGVIIGGTEGSDGKPIFDLERMMEITANLNWALGEVFSAEYHADTYIGSESNLGGLVMLSQDSDEWWELQSDEYNLDATSEVPLDEQALSILRKWSSKFDQAISNIMTLRYKLDAKKPATPNWRDEFESGDENDDEEEDNTAGTESRSTRGIGNISPYFFYAGNVRFEPRMPGMMQLREGQATCIFPNEDDPYEKGRWTDGYGNYWFADGAFEQDRDSSEMDIIGPWPGCGFRMLGKGEPWSEGDSHYDVNTDTWVDGEPANNIPVHALFVRRMMIPSMPQGGNQSLPAKAANLLNEAAAHPKSGFEPLPEEVDPHLPPLLIDILDSQDELVRTVEIPDPRNSFVRSFNSYGIGQRAVVVGEYDSFAGCDNEVIPTGGALEETAADA
jgi:hypothetical protein